MTTLPKPPEDLLEAAYNELDFYQGTLLPAASEPSPGGEDDWVEKGEWLSLANKIGVEKVLFVDSNPVVVFARTIEQNPDKLRELYNRIWCMARPQLLFLACPGELAVMDLTRPPVRPQEAMGDQDRILDIVRTVADVQTELQAYHRSRIETGRLFEDARFFGTGHRSDETLIRDLKTVRRQLCDAGLTATSAHALIGRSIFVRYLEDRRILTPEYFEAIANAKPEWIDILSASHDRPDVNPDMEALLYPKVLSNKEFAYALFDRLSEDFNGDIFPFDPREMDNVGQTHLNLLREFLQGDTGPQQSLFFFAYRFDVIPIELISSIYEEFYNAQEGDDKNQGSHYTPGALVEFLLSQVLTQERLAKDPRVMDPACGSGIFLVEAFRRIVRYRVTRQLGTPLTREQLLGILREQICGIEINQEAVRVAAFSLYLAFLHYQDPPDIQQNKRLPNLKYDGLLEKDAANQFDILVAANSFTIGANLLEQDIKRRFTGPCVDIVVGNPPWGYPGKEDLVGRESAFEAVKWCKARLLPLGDKELSQAFIYRTLEFLRDGGCAGLLVSSGVFFKSHPNSRMFRRTWLSASVLTQVVNFAHVRDVFFSGRKRGATAIAPFASVVFTKGSLTDNNHAIEYWSAKKTPLVEKLEAVVLSTSDRKMLSQRSVLGNDILWKVYWWGGYSDECLIQKLNFNPSLMQVDGLIMPEGTGSGYKAGQDEDAGWLREFPEIPTEELKRYGPLSLDNTVAVPELVARKRERHLFEGMRLLMKHGPAQADNQNGQIIARIDSRPFCFRHSIYSFRFGADVTWQATVLLGILWSSLARYYFFLTASSWGTWHHSIGLDEVRNFPVRLPDSTAPVRMKIEQIVNALRSEPENFGGLFAPADQQALREEREALELDLDEAVFDLYRLTDPERDLIRDLCRDTLDLFYNHTGSNAVKPVENLHKFPEIGSIDGLFSDFKRRAGIEPYLYAFLSSWNGYTEPEGQFYWRIIRPSKNIPLLAIVFTAQTDEVSSDVGRHGEWADLLEAVNATSTQHFHSRRVFTDGIVRIISGAQIIIIKRNERRLWNATSAREDAEATMLYAIQAHEALQETSL